MDQSSIDMIIDDVAEARAKLYYQHCMGDACEREATLCLATQFLYQACTILQAIYGGNENIVKKHIVHLLYCDAKA